MTSFHLIIAVAALLTTLGLIMVLSASGVRSYDDDGSAWIIFGKQVLWTVVGLVEAFQRVAEMEARVSPALLASGIWAALITTVGGLFVAIPTFIVHHYFKRKVSHLAFQIEHYGSELLLLMKREARRAPAAEWAMGESQCSD